MSENNSFTNHFIELRSRLIQSIIFIFIIFVISYIFAEEIYSFLVDPYANATAGSVRIIALQDVDFGVKQPGAFCFGT